MSVLTEESLLGGHNPKYGPTIPRAADELQVVLLTDVADDSENHRIHFYFLLQAINDEHISVLWRAANSPQSTLRHRMMQMNIKSQRYNSKL